MSDRECAGQRPRTCDRCCCHLGLHRACPQPAERDGRPSYSEASRLDRVTPFPLCPAVRPMGPVGQETRHSRTNVPVSILPSSRLCYKH